MKYIKGLAKRKMQNWTGKQWYHQRFDGAPYFMHFIAEGEIQKHEQRKLGGDFTVHYCFYDDGKADWYILMDDIKKVTSAIIDASKKNPNISLDLINLWQDDTKLFYEMCIKAGNTDLTKLNDKQLIELHDVFAEITLNKNSSSSLIDGFALGTDELIANKIKHIYDQSDIKHEFRSAEVFSILTAPVHLSFINEAEVELFKLAIKLKEKDLDNLDEESYKLVKDYQKSFFWIQNNYVYAKVLDTSHFIQEIKNLYGSKIDIEHELDKVQNTPNVNKNKKEELMRKLDIDKELKTLIKISQDFTYWQDERKKSTFWYTHYFSLILAEISKRINIDLQDLKYMTCREVSTIFENKPDADELKARKMNGVYYWDKEGMEALHSKDADEVKKAILGEINFEDIDDFRGLSACTGRAVGPVKILKSSTELSKIEKGDILVAVMTRPDYIPAMKRASAIVTDEGGITSHAAIVSRELGVPCIIGTKIATKILKDGQIVEVNANHGWVRILK